MVVGLHRGAVGLGRRPLAPVSGREQTRWTSGDRTTFAKRSSEPVAPAARRPRNSDPPRSSGVTQCPGRLNRPGLSG